MIIQSFIYEKKIKKENKIRNKQYRNEKIVELVNFITMKIKFQQQKT